MNGEINFQNMPPDLQGAKWISLPDECRASRPYPITCSATLADWAASFV